MNMYAIIIIVLVVAMVVGPVAMIQPNRGQRRREQLRGYAQRKGLSVRILPPPQLPTDAQAPGAMPVYSLVSDTPQTTRWTLMRARYAHEGHLASWWLFVGQKPPEPLQRHIEGVLEMLPKGVIGLRATGRQLDIFWGETGGEQEVDQLLKCLHYLAG
ncbi:hypothetical protein [Gilvimarinus japonicus]